MNHGHRNELKDRVRSRYDRRSGGHRNSEYYETSRVYKNFYSEHRNISSLRREEVEEIRHSLQITVSGRDVPAPIRKLKEGNFPEYIYRAIEKMKFTKPTAIQAQVWPIALSGRDLIGIAQTGSGKTLSFLLPACVHIRNQPQNDKDYGPIALILAPTRELARQIQDVCYHLERKAHIKSCCFVGGESKGRQLREAAGAQICISTPGRLIDFLHSKEVSLNRCTFLVLDEADRMLDMGFEPQIRRIIERIKRGRQTLMFSATWPREISRLAEEFLDDYIEVNIGALALSANSNIKQIVDVVEETEKEEKLLSLLQRLMAEKKNKTIIFAETKVRVNELADNLRDQGYPASCIHGNKSQAERNRVLNDFKSGKTPILVATNVASRGLGDFLILRMDYFYNLYFG